MTERFTASLGPGAAKNKESQALLKTMEASVAAYKVNLHSVADEDSVAALSAEGGDSPALLPHRKLTHKALLSAAAHCRMAIVRLDAGATLATAPSVNALAEKCLEAVRVHHGPVGWIVVDDNNRPTATTTVADSIHDNHHVPAERVQEEAALSSVSASTEQRNYLGLSDHDVATLKDKSGKVLLLPCSYRRFVKSPNLYLFFYRLCYPSCNIFCPTQYFRASLLV